MSKISFIFAVLFSLVTNVAFAAYVKDGGSDLTTEDSDACGIFDRGIANYKKDETFTFSKPGGYWLYTAADQHGNSGVCWNYSPTAFNFTYFKRTGDSNDNIEYIYRESTCAHRISPDDAAGYCWDGLTDGYVVKFGPADIVSKDSAAGNKTSYAGDWAPGSVICAKRIKPGEKYLHDSKDYDTKGTNDTGVNQICAYRVYSGTDTCNSPFPDWNGAYFGCVAEIPPPGPDVMNSVVPSNLTPVVHYKMCMDDQGNGRTGCDPSYLKLVGQGSTFDKPMVPLTDNKGGLLFLQYQFKDDISTDPKYHPTCARFISSSQGVFDDATQYCAQVPKDDPSKVCACIKRNDGTDPLSLTHIDYCGPNSYIGCVDRPTLEHSKLKLVAEFVLSEDTLRNRQNPAIRPVFATTDANGNVVYADESNDVVCQSPTYNMMWMKCNPDGTPTETAATGKVRVKDRLKLPLDTVKIKEYTPAYFSGVACKDSTNTNVTLNYDGVYYTLDANGVMTTTKAGSSVSCTYNSATVQLADVRPKQYLRDTETIYGVKFSAMIPVLDTDNTIKYGKYTGPHEALDAGSSCYALKKQLICSTQGKKAFYPAGARDTTYCNVLDLTKPPCNAYNFQHDAEAVSLFCPGYFSESIESGAGSKICLDPTSSWKFRTIEDYKTTVSTKTPSDLLALSCQTKDTDELCKDMEMSCKKIPFPTKSKGLVTTTKDLVYGQLGITICDAAYGLSNPLYFRLLGSAYDPNVGSTVPTFDKTSVCNASLPAGKNCDDYYNEFMADLNAYDKLLLKKKDDLMLTQYLKMNLDDMAAILTPFFAKYLPGEPITYWTSPLNMSQGLTVFRKCEGGGFGRLFIPSDVPGGDKANCVMRRECQEITKSAEFTGFATWANTDIQSVITNPTTVAANKGKKVDLTIPGTCEANYKPTTGTKPQRTCTVTYKADGSIGYTEWKLPIVNPCIPQ